MRQEVECVRAPDRDRDHTEFQAHYRRKRSLSYRSPCGPKQRHGVRRHTPLRRLQRSDWAVVVSSEARTRGASILSEWKVTAPGLLRGPLVSTGESSRAEGLRHRVRRTRESLQERRYDGRRRCGTGEEEADSQVGGVKQCNADWSAGDAGTEADHRWPARRAASRDSRSQLTRRAVRAWRRKSRSRQHSIGLSRILLHAKKLPKLAGTVLKYVAPK
jgi:hypothetical protein